MAGGGGVLAVDFGTSHTVAMIGTGDGAPQPLLFDGSPLLSSGVWVGSGMFATGRDARHFAGSRPDGYEPAPKARVDEGRVLLGGAEVDTVDLIAAPLARVLAEAVRVTGGRPATTVLTCPAAWAAPRRAVLAAAAERAGFGTPVLLPEPVAAGAYHLRHHPGSPGRTVLVYDFGGGTFDVSLLRWSPTGPRVLATEGLPDAGGADVDEAIVGYLAAVYGPRHPEIWQRLERPVTGADRHARHTLWESARAAKEMLSRAATSYVHIPLLDVEAPLGREQFERLAQPVVNRTVRACRSALAAAGVAPAELDVVLLVGGSSRIPLAATLLHRAFGMAPTAVEQPELVVAEGAVAALADPAIAATLTDLATTGPAATGPAATGPAVIGPAATSPAVAGQAAAGHAVTGRAAPTSPAAPISPAAAAASHGGPTGSWPAAVPEPASPGPRRRWVRPAAAAAVVIVLAALGVAAYVFIPSDGGPGASPTSSSTVSGLAATGRPSTQSSAVREFLSRWTLPSTVCGAAFSEFPFTPPAPTAGLVEAVRCEHVQHGGKYTRVLAARFSGKQARAEFLTAHNLNPITTEQERVEGTIIQTIWYPRDRDDLLGWLQPGWDLDGEKGRQLFRTVEK